VTEHFENAVIFGRVIVVMRAVQNFESMAVPRELPGPKTSSLN